MSSSLHGLGLESDPLHSLVADTAELTHSVVRDFFVNGVAAQRLRQPTRAHGCFREQGGRAEALGHYNRRFHRAILPAEIVLLERTGGMFDLASEQTGVIVQYIYSSWDVTSAF